MGQRPTSVRHLRASLGVGNKKPPKYGNKKVTYQGITFDSQRECERYKELLILQSVNKIGELTLQPKFWLKCGKHYILKRSKRYPNGRKCSYRADFSYNDRELGERIVEDVKGYDTSESRLRRAIVEAQYGVRVVIVR